MAGVTSVGRRDRPYCLTGQFRQAAVIPRVEINDPFDGLRWFPGRREAASAMGVHRASGATHPEIHLGPPKAGRFSSLDKQVAYLGAA
jgi:hypothetical protein